MSARVPPSILHKRALELITEETAAERRLRILRALETFFTEFAVQVIEVIGAGIILSLSLQLVRPEATFNVGTGTFYRYLAGHASEPEWAAIAGFIGAIPLFAFLVNSKALRWLALIGQVAFFATWTWDAYRGGPIGVLWIFTLWLFLGCAMGSVKLAFPAAREVLRRTGQVYGYCDVRLYILRAKRAKRKKEDSRPPAA